jgi:sugar O-acyltransferase (sialic acid O-acetyltransferase NeuD family)
MDNLLILGTGVHAAEMVEIVERVNRIEKTWNLQGCVCAEGDEAPDALNGCPVLTPNDVIETYPTAYRVPAYGWPRLGDIPRHHLVSLIDPTVFVSRTARIGVGCVVYPHCYIGAYAHVGDFLFCLSGSVINHDVVLEDRVTLASGATLAGFVHVEADCYLGQSCTCRQQLRIGAGSLIGMGSVVVKDVPPHSVMAGNPARKLRSNRTTA